MRGVQVSPGVTRAIVPAFLNIDEDRDAVGVDVQHRVLAGTVRAGFRYEKSDVDDSLNVRRSPDQAADRCFAQANRVSSDLFGESVFTSTPLLDESAAFSTSRACVHLDSNIGGSGIYDNEFNPPLNPVHTNRHAQDQGLLDLDGSTKLHQHVGALTLQARVLRHLQTTACGRFEREGTNGNSGFVDTNVGFGPPSSPTPVSQNPLAATSDSDMTSCIGDPELRYTGLKDWVWTIFGERDDRDADINETGDLDLDPSTPPDQPRATDLDRSGQKYGLGVPWYPFKRINIASRYRYGIRDYDYAHHSVGLALTDSIDPRSQHFFYCASNFEKDLTTSQHYGADATEHGVSLQLGYRNSEQIRWRTGFAYFTNDEATAGRANDYDATVLTGGVDMKF